MENFFVSVLGNPLMTAGFAGFPSLSPSQLMASSQPHSAGWVAAVWGDQPPATSHKCYLSARVPWLCSILLILPVLANGRESEQMVQQRPYALLLSVLLMYCLSECSCFPFSKPLWAPLSPSRWPFFREDAGCSHWWYSLLWRKAQPRCLY